MTPLGRVRGTDIGGSISDRPSRWANDVVKSKEIPETGNYLVNYHVPAWSFPSIFKHYFAIGKASRENSRRSPTLGSNFWSRIVYGGVQYHVLDLHDAISVQSLTSYPNQNCAFEQFENGSKLHVILVKTAIFYSSEFIITPQNAILAHFHKSSNAKL